MNGESEFEKRLFMVGRELDVTTDRIVEYLQEHGYEDALAGSGFSASIVEEEIYLRLRDEFASDPEATTAFHETEKGRSQNGHSSALSPEQCVCGSTSVEVTGENENVKVCRACGISWYVNHCWNCESTIDSRSETVIQCDGCSWYRCGQCGECREDCTHDDKSSTPSGIGTRSGTDGAFEKTLFELAEELDISSGRIANYLKENGHASAIEGAGLGVTLTSEDAYRELQEEYSDDASSAESQEARSTPEGGSPSDSGDTSEEGTDITDEWFSDERSRRTSTGSGAGEDEQAFLHIQLTTTGAEQLLQSVERSGRIPEKDHRKRREAGQILQTYSSERTATYISRMQDTDRDSNESMVSLRLKNGKGSIELVLTPKEKCFLLLGVRPRDTRERVYEEEVEVKLFVDSDGQPPISKELWERIETLNTKEERAEEVERRLRQWTAYLRVQEKEAERRQFHLLYDSVRHLEKSGRIRLRLSQREQNEDRSRLKQARRDRVSIYETASANGRSVARAEVVHYDEQEHCLILDLMDEDAERLQTERLTIPPTGSVEHQARGALSMIHRQQDAIETLKQNGGAMEKLDRFLFGSDEEIDPPAFGPVSPLPASECLDPEHTNEEQRLAVANALECPDMFFLQGPPGTGKTTFIAELCYQLGRRGKRALVASQANLAVDNALGRLQKNRDILAVRKAKEKKVEEEGKPFVGENAVRTWLQGVAGHAEARVERQEDARRARRLAKENRELLDSWIENGEEASLRIDRLREKIGKYEEEISNLQTRQTELRESADTLTSLTEILSPDDLLTQEGHWQKRESAAEREEAWSEVDPSVRTTWRSETEQARGLVEENNGDPWSICTTLNRLSTELKSDGGYAEKVEAATEAYEHHRSLAQQVQNAKQRLGDAEAQLDRAKHRKKDHKEALKQLPEIDQENRRIDPDRINADHFPVWAASARRASEARALLVGRERRRGSLPQRSAKELARLWSDAEMANRGEDAEYLLERLKVAVTLERERAQWWVIGWLYRLWLPYTLSAVENAIEKVEDCIRGYSSPLSEHIEKEIRRLRLSLRDNIEEAEEKISRLCAQVREAEDDLSALTDEVAVITDQLHSRFERLLPADGGSGDSPLDRFISTMEALSSAPERLSELREQVAQQRGEVRRALRKTREKLRSLAQERRETIEENNRRIERRRETIRSLKDEVQEIRARHAEARAVWEEICSTDPERSAQEVEERPSREWLDRYIEPLGNGEWERLATEKDIVDDWTDAIAEEDQQISEGLKTRFFRNANVVGATCARAGKDDFRNQYGIFDVVIVDEVSKATPTELLMPALLGKKVVLVGDHRQLAPVFGHQSNFEAAADDLGMNEKDLQENLRRSLFKERFEYFSEQENAREEPEGDGYAGRRTLMLTKQYRMHSQIMRGINQFYNEKLELGHLRENGEEIPLDEVRDHGLEISPWASENRHLVWVDTPVEGDWEHTQEGPTRYNEKEMETTLSMLQSLASAFEGADREALSVGVTSVYAAQVNRLRQKVRQLSLPDEMREELRISTVDRFQGMERDIMVLNLVLNRQGLPPSKWLRTPERINVAMSRARRLLVIVGSKHNYVEVDGTSPAYTRFFNVARKYGHYVRANHILDQSHMDGDRPS
jgi:methyl-accepting chemotaxis protein